MIGVFVGLATLDVIQRVDRLPDADEKVTSTRLDVAAGGPAANAAVAFAALGGQAILVSALGAGTLADLARADLAACGVEVRDVAGPDACLPVSTIMVTESTGQRAIVGRDGVADPEAPSWLANLTRRADVVEVDGHYPRLAMVCEGDVVVDAGRWKPVFGCLATDRIATAFACSQGWRPPGGGSQDDAAAWLRARGVGQVCFTNGPDPVRWWEGARRGDIEVAPVEAVDTVGAGDVFHGALCHARARGEDWPAQIAAGNAMAARRVNSMGPRTFLGR